MKIDGYHDIEYDFLKHMFKERMPKTAIELRDYLSIAIGEDDWENQRDYTNVVYVTLKEALWYAEEIEDYEFCAKLNPLIDKWYNYSEKLDEELEHYD